jgi:hypothetical protein
MLWWIRIRKVLPKENHRGFDSLFFVVGWTLWKERQYSGRCGNTKQGIVWRCVTFYE